MAVNSDGVLVSGGGYSYVIISENSVYPCEGHNGSIPLLIFCNPNLNTTYG